MGGVEPIVYSEILKWLDEHYVFEAERRDRAVYHVQALDMSYMDHMHKAMEDDIAKRKREQDTASKR